MQRNVERQAKKEWEDNIGKFKRGDIGEQEAN